MYVISVNSVFFKVFNHSVSDYFAIMHKQEIFRGTL